MQKEKKTNNPEPVGLSESGIDLSAKSPCVVFSLIILVQIDSEGINHCERHGCSWGEKLLSFVQIT